MNVYEEMIAALEIFKKYPEDPAVTAGHGVIFAGPYPHLVSREDKEALERLGWVEDEDGDGFVLYV